MSTRATFLAVLREKFEYNTKKADSVKNEHLQSYYEGKAMAFAEAIQVIITHG